MIVILLIIPLIFTASKAASKNYVAVSYKTDQGIDLDEFYIKRNFKNYNIFLGKKHINFKNSDFLRLIVNKNGPSFPMIYFNKKYKYFTGETAVIFAGESVDRRLFIHRLTNSNLINNLQIGISESVIAHNKINPFYYTPTPYIPYYLIKKIAGLDNEYNYYDDSYIGIDFKYENNKLTFYGELLVDEYPYQDFATNPDKRAHLIGLKLPFRKSYWLNIEYSNVYAGVYQHRFDENEYKYLNEYIGHRYGPDTKEYYIETGVDRKEHKYIIYFANIKKGANELDGSTNVGDGGILLKELKTEFNEYGIKYQLNKKNLFYEMEFKYINNLTQNKNDYKFYLKAKYEF